MRTYRWLMAAILIGTMACARGAVAEKITVDPNAPGTQAAQENESEQADERLSQKVTYEATRKSVSRILEEISEKTGVSLRSGHNKFDWQVRDRKMNIYSKNATLASLMSSIARVMKFRWSKEKLKDGKYVYRLYMDRRTLLDEEAMRAREEERLVRLEAERRHNALDSITGLADMSPEEIEKLRSENPFLYVLGKAGLGKPLKGLFAEVPAISQALANGEVMDIPASAVSAQGKTCMMDSLKAIWSVMQIATGKAEPFQTDEAYSEIDQATIRINPNLETINEFQRQHMFMLGEISINIIGGMPGLAIPLIDPDSGIAKVLGEMLVSDEETGGPPKDAVSQPEMQQRLMAASAADLKRTEPQEAKIDHPDEPALHAKVKIKRKSSALSDVEAALAKASGLAVVSDSFRRSFSINRPLLTDKEMELKDALEEISNSFKYDWDKHGSVIELRDRQWFKKRAMQIPEAWLEEWRYKLKETGTLELGDLARICGLTQEQFRENIASDEILRMGGLSETYCTGRYPLRLYGSLSESQRYAAFTESGLDLRSLLPDQWAQAVKMLSNRGPLPLHEDIPLILTAGQSKDGERLIYWFEVTRGEGVEALKWDVQAPKYEKPDEPIQEKMED